MSGQDGRAYRIAVCAPGDASDDELVLAGAVGRVLAERGCTLVCGGLGGAMAAAARGAPRVQSQLDGQQVRKTVVVPQKLVNLVVG
jgi:predicted Rossmann-fold nucleotide-binding protein